MTKALVVTAHGDRDVLAVEAIAPAAPGPGQARVRVAAAGVNFIDVYQRQGIYPIPTPFILGMEGAGEIESVGAGVDLPVGTRVAWCMTPGSMAELAVLPADKLVPIPEGVGPVVAAGAMLQGMTAHFLVNSTYAVGEGTVALVHAAAGGVGQLLTQLIVAKGGTVIATASTPEKLAIAAARGARHTIDYSQVDDLAAAVREANDGKGVDVVYDGVGKSTFDASLASLRPRGLMVLFGGASGQVPPFDIQRLNTSGSLYLTRPTLGSYLADRAELQWRSHDVLTAVADGSLQIDIGGSYPLEDAAAAYEALENRRTTGKLVLTL